MNVRIGSYIVLYFLSYFYINAQELKFTAHFILNEKPLSGVHVSVFDMAKGNLIESVQINKSNLYKIDLETGNNYKIVFSHPKAHQMFFEIISNNMNENSLYNNYYYEIDVEFIPSTETVDTSVLFKQPLHRIIFNGKKFEDDVAYNKMIIQKIFREEQDIIETNKPIKIPYNWAGTLYIKAGNNSTPLSKKDVVLFKSNKMPYFYKQTNNFGQFFFNKVYADSAHSLFIDLKEKEAIGKTLILADSKKNLLYETKITDTKVEILLSQSLARSLIDNRFSFFIGGKIYKECDTSVVFYAEEPVFLLNQNGTIIQSTKTNIFGAFVFQDIKPGYIYQIAVKKDAIKRPYKAMLYNNIDEPICEIDSSLAENQIVCSFRADNNKKFDNLLINESLLKMNIKGKVYNENANNPVSDLKIYLINEYGKVVDSTITDNFGSFIFAFVPYMKYSFKFYDPSNSIVTSSKILLYSSNDQLVKLLYMVKNNPFIFNLLDYEQKKLSEIYSDDPWLNISSLKLKNNNIPTITEHLYFVTNQYNITYEGEKILKKVLTIMLNNPQYNIETRAYTDSRADDKYNLELSHKRANAVKNYLIQKGISADRIIAKGLGEENILNHCKNGVPCTDDEHAVNRRVEFDLKVK
ncbi:MAG: OmpA family protein [Bacteroidia bacterium]|nr:OmpA family protein [Bacteroidia bacterium]